MGVHARYVFDIKNLKFNFFEFFEFIFFSFCYIFTGEIATILGEELKVKKERET